MRSCETVIIGKDTSTEAEESALLGAVNRKRLVRPGKTLCILQYSDL
jgi:hypothetical protein